MPPLITPAWVHDAIFYQIFPDRFARSQHLPKPNNLEPWETPPTTRGFKGGDLLGVIEHLDYLQDLGITAIYFNPIFQSASTHRYHTHDYYQVDPLLGGNAAFQKMLKAAHRRGIRLILDGVFNHANPQVRQYIFDVARFWLEQGIDGWRLDVPFEIKDDSFWQEFRQIVKGINPEAYIAGEIPWEAQHWLQGDQFDAVMNYQFTQACLGFFSNGKINWAQERE